MTDPQDEAWPMKGMAYLQQKVRTCWWFDGNGHEAAAFYVTLLPDSAIEGGHGPEGGPPLVVEFTLAGAPMMILNGGPGPAQSGAASIGALTESQSETDRLRTALTADGGEESRCGRLTDRWGVSWQIVLRRLPEMLGSPDRAASARAFEAMMRMGKLDLAALEAAFAG
jgi:predicted 3-demethylubiquinone-9 3-methyltransferase (glyoxalase superfamily)